MLRPFKPLVFFDEEGKSEQTTPEVKSEPTGESLATDDMLADIDALFNSPAAEKPEEAGEKVEEEPEVEPAKEEVSVKEEEPKPEEVKPEESKPEDKKEEPKKDEEPDELADLKAHNEALLATIEKITSGQTPETTEAQETKTAAKPEEEKEPAIVKMFEDVKFLTTDEDYTKAIGSKEGLADFGNQLLNANTQRTLQAIVPAIRQLIPQYVELTISTEKFFAANPDLVPVKRLVTEAAAQIKQKEPNITLTKLMENAGKEVRESLKMPRKVGDNKTDTSSKEPTKKPKFGKGDQKLTSPTKQKVSEEQGDIDEMLEVAGA